ncbi:class I SAM-dependent methyltransferase [Nocardioides antri]|uniref:Methyltransferase domain-containing protein n=1 Tax=Nocardioides antri TaxID=2607659 RepID=A0A5B1M938_9ACTN|nr:class I SAM-dependent methyltransferase [Nocardioides antri]KAA1428457.1 methyltransferase domain-containing protein [Nocardioides antri]
MDLGARIAEWDAEAPAYDEPADHGLTDRAVRSAWRTLLLGALPPAPARVADLGCGTGTLSLLLAEEGYRVDGVDFSPAMVERARAKLAGVERATVTEGDAYEPPLPASSYDAVLCRHVLWAMPDPATALARWLDLLRPGGRLVLVEGAWSTGAGLTAAATVDLVAGAGLEPSLTLLDDPALWGGPTTDERYLVSAVTG